MSGFNLGQTQKQSEQAEEHLHDASTRLANLHKIKPVGLEGFEKELYRCLGSLVAAVGSSNTVMRQMYLLRTPAPGPEVKKVVPWTTREYVGTEIYAKAEDIGNTPLTRIRVGQQVLIKQLFGWVWATVFCGDEHGTWYAKD